MTGSIVVREAVAARMHGRALLKGSGTRRALFKSGGIGSGGNSMAGPEFGYTSDGMGFSHC